MASKYFLIASAFSISLILGPNVLSAQTVADPPDSKASLNERYFRLKEAGQNYRDYKVIKERTLDEFWKVVKDSLAAKQSSIVRQQLAQKGLQDSLEYTKGLLDERERSMAATEFASTHIQVLGIDMTKGGFLTTIGVIMSLLLILLGLGFWRWKTMNRYMHDRIDAFNTLNAEFEEYKRKAMEKQTKLSRELQNERNRLQELRGLS